MFRPFLIFAAVFGMIFAVIWAASFTGYFDKARVQRITRVAVVGAVTAFFTIAVVIFLLGLEHTIF